VSLTDKVFSGASWLLFGQILGYIAQIISMTILARLLLPEDYGVYSIAIAFTAFGGLVVNTGFGEALIHKKDVTQEDTHSVFWLTMLLAALMIIIINFVAKPVADFYAVPMLEWVLRSLSINFLIGPLSSVPNMLLLKALRTNTVAIIQVSSQLTSTLIMLILAFLGYGIWSLVIGSVVNTLIRTVFMFHGAGWYPIFQFNLKAIWNLLRFTLNFLGFKFLSYWARNIDSFVIGRVFKAADLGLYNRAYGLMMFPTANLANSLSQIMFPALATIKDDKERVKNAYLNTLRLIMFLILPMMFGLTVLAESFVITIYGENWRGMIIIIQLLAPVGILQSIVATTYWIYLSQGMTDYMLGLELLNIGGTIGAITMGIFLGSIEAVAFGYLIANIILFYPSILIPGRLINLHFYELIRHLWKIFFYAILMSLVLIIVLIITDWTHWQRLLFGILLGSSIYFGTSLLTKDTTSKVFFTIINTRLILPLMKFVAYHISR
jgi:O-antigen/teichoic acid export membrane protein